MTAGLVPPRDSLCSVSVLLHCSSYPPPAALAGSRHRTPGLAPQASSCRISPINLRAGSSFPSSQQIPAQPEILVFKGKASEPEFPFCTGQPQPSHQALYLRRTGAEQIELPEAHCPQPPHRKEAPGALTGGYMGRHLGTTVKDRT